MEWKYQGGKISLTEYTPDKLARIDRLAELEAERDRLRALLTEVGEPNDEEGCVYCEQPLLYNGMKHLPTCITVRIKAELAGGGGV